MKNILFIIAITLSIKVTAQSSIKTITLSVKGNCEQCKERIENAADIKGVKKCTWSDKTQVATIIFDTTKTTDITIEKAIAKAGHETANQTANDKSYNQLPTCCKYKQGACQKK